MKKRTGSILFAAIVVIGGINIAIVHRANTQSATPTWDQYCSSCHGTASSFGPRTVAQIQAALTSVSQMKNISLTSAQIQAISNELSGNTADTTPPTVTGFTIPSTSNSLTVSITAFSATDNVGVTGYMVTSTTATPGASSTKWSATPPTSFTFPGTTKSGAKTLYAWTKDAAKNVSKSLSAQVTINLPGPDKTKPTVTAFAISPSSNSLTVSITTFTGTDNVGVTGYMVTSTTAKPGALSTKWSATPPTSFTFPATTKSGAKTLYAWVKDAGKNVSLSLSAQVTLNLPGPDKTKPTVTAFAISPSSSSLTVSITTFAATDNVGVTGYMVTSTALAPGPLSAKWSATPPTSFTFPATTKSGAKTLYAWVKDAGKNVSLSLSAQVTLTLTAPQAAQNPTSPATALSATASTVPQGAQNPTSQAAAPDATISTAPQTAISNAIPDMQNWVGRWFKINVQNKGFYTSQSGLSSDRQSIPGYLKIWAWDPTNKVFQGDLYQYDAQLNQWVSDPLVLYYISGGDLDFMASSQVVGDLTYGFTARIQGTEANGVLVEATFRTLGGYHLQWDNQQGKHWAGWLVVTGKMVFESEVQIPADKIRH
jgi:hypothetical protein